MKLTVDFAQQLDLVSNSLFSLKIVDDIKTIASENAEA